MKKQITTLVAASSLSLALATAAGAVSDAPKSLDLKVTLQPYAQLSIGAASLDFGSQATPGTAVGTQATAYTAKLRKAATDTGYLTITGADLVGPDATLPIAKAKINITPDCTATSGACTATAGPIALAAPQQIVSFAKSGEYGGNLTFALNLTTADFWALPSGDYVGTQTLTLSAP